MWIKGVSIFETAVMIVKRNCLLLVIEIVLNIFHPKANVAATFSSSRVVRNGT